MHPFQIDQYFIYPHYWNHTHLPTNKTHTCTSHASYLGTHPSSQPMKEKMDHSLLEIGTSQKCEIQKTAAR